jgi:hypothetical protein
MVPAFVSAVRVMAGIDTAIEKLVPLAEQFGPFLFSILFLLVITRTAHGYYRDCTMRKPPASAEEVKAYRNYFVCSMWFGIAVTTLSIGWWVFVHLQSTHTYQMTVLNLHDGEEVSAEYYSRRGIRAVGANIAPMHDLYFIIVQPQPFNVGDKFTFYVYKRPQSVTAGSPGIVPTEVVVKYSGRSADTFSVDFSKTKPELQLVNSEPAPAALPARDIALAKIQYLAALTGGRSQ